MLLKCFISKADILHAEEVFGPDLGSLEGKMTRTKPSKVLINKLDDLPTNLKCDISNRYHVCEQNNTIYNYHIMRNTLWKGTNDET